MSSHMGCGGDVKNVICLTCLNKKREHVGPSQFKQKLGNFMQRVRTGEPLCVLASAKIFLAATTKIDANECKAKHQQPNNVYKRSQNGTNG